MFKSTALILASLGILSASAPAQELNLPLPGVTGTIGLDGTVDKFYGVTHTALVKTADGVRHLVHLTSGTTVHGTNAKAEDPFGGLEEGSHVVVHYSEKNDKKTAIEIDRVGDGGLKVVEGEVVDVDRPAKKLTVQLPDDSWLILRLTDRAARDVGKDVAHRNRIVVYYADDNGDQVAHYFKKAR